MGNDPVLSQRYEWDFEGQQRLTRERDEARQCAERYEGLLTEWVVEIVDDDCWTDHHGNCQAHFLQPAEECIVRRSRQALGLDAALAADPPAEEGGEEMTASPP